MRVVNTEIDGVVVIEAQPNVDERGLFSRTWCRRELEAAGLCGEWVQSSVSLNHAVGTLRGMHYQSAPHEEIKLVRCTRGAIFDVSVDLRPESSTFSRWIGVELTADNYRAVYIPKGVAHGFLTREPDSEVLYLMSEYYEPSAAKGFHWGDPKISIAWPETPRIVSDKDQAQPNLSNNP